MISHLNNDVCVLAGYTRGFEGRLVMKKRFIAGVVCPKCGALDSIMAVNDTHQEVLIRDCIDCGFTDRLSTGVNQTKEVSTRITADDSFVNAAVEVIKIIE